MTIGRKRSTLKQKICTNIKDNHETLTQSQWVYPMNTSYSANVAHVLKNRYTFLSMLTADAYCIAIILFSHPTKKQQQQQNKSPSS